MYPTSFQIVTRTANRLLFGADLARNKEFLQLSIDYSETFFGGANMIRHYPEWMKPLVLYFKTGISTQTALAKKHLYPLLRERIQAMKAAEHIGTLDEFNKTKPSDTGDTSCPSTLAMVLLLITIIVQWVLDITPPEKLDLGILTLRLIHILVAAVHTSSVTYLNAVYDLALHPEIHDELREEIYAVFASEDGKWRKQGLTKLMKLDSFIKESARFHPMQAGKFEKIGGL